MPIPLMIAWAMLKGWATAVFELWRALPGPVKAAILIALALFVGVLWGEHDGARRCRARIDASIEAARGLDASISAETKNTAAKQVAEAQAREAAVREEVKRYADELAQKTAVACQSGSAVDDWNDGLGVSDDTVQQPGTKPAPGGGHRAVTVPLPPRKGQ